jgi:hypothetical protein
MNKQGKMTEFAVVKYNTVTECATPNLAFGAKLVSQGA